MSTTGAGRLAVALLAAVTLACTAACGTARHGSAPAGPHPRSSSAASPAPAPTATAHPAASLPPGAPAPSPAGIPHHGQTLVVAGSVRGTVADAEIRQCGPTGTTWYLQLFGMTIGAAQGSLSISAPGYSGPRDYRPQGSLMLIADERASFLSVTGGTLTVRDRHSGTMAVTFSGGGDTVTVTGAWSCGTG